MHKYIPILDWLSSYSQKYLKGDVSAGLTVGIMLVPQGMAYALLAGLPPIYGLYAATIPLLLYSIFGTSRQLAVGPVALDAILIFSGVSAFVAPETDLYTSYVMLLMLMVGVIQLVMGIFKMGFLVNFLSRPVIAGFTTAAAIIIASSQLSYLLGIEIPRSGFYHTITSVFGKLGELNLPTTILGFVTIVLLIAFKKWLPQWPRLLIVVLLGILAVLGFELESKGLKVLGEVPSGLPSFKLQVLEVSTLLELLPMAITLAFIGFMESIAIGKSLEAKGKEYEIDPNQELRALGIANSIGSFFKGMPVSGGFSRSAVNFQAGAKTGLASIISAILVVISLLFLTPYFYHLPFAVLGAIIIVSVVNLMDFTNARLLWTTDRKDFWVFVATAFVTVFLGIKEGIIFGVLLSLVLLIYKESYPHIAELARVPGSKEFRNVHRFEGLESYKGILIIRFDALLYFANANRLRDYIRERIKTDPELKYLILDASAISSVDSTAMYVLQGILEDLSEKGITLYIVDVKGPVRDIFAKNSFLNESEFLFFALNIDRALDRILNQGSKKFEKYTFQVE